MSTSKVPQLPPTDNGEVSSLRYEVNPAIALNALADIYQHVQRYQVQLRQLAHQIHQVYAEGPVVSGWLTSHQYKRCQQLSETDVTLFRHGDADDLMNYLSALENTIASITDAQPNSASDSAADDSDCSSSHGLPTSQYYLCQLTSCGQIQAEQCPPDQVPVLSMAIARYRRLNQLMKQKQAIEAKLQTVMDILVDAQTVLDTPD